MIADSLFITFIFADRLFISFIFDDRLFITFIFAESVYGEDAWSVRKDVAELDEGFLDDGESIEHDHQSPAQVQAEHVSVLTPPRPELGPGVLVQQVEVTQQWQGKAGTRGQSCRSSRGQPPQQGQDQHTAQQQGRGVQQGQHRHGPELEKEEEKKKESRPETCRFDIARDKWSRKNKSDALWFYLSLSVLTLKGLVPRVFINPSYSHIPSYSQGPHCTLLAVSEVTTLRGDIRSLVSDHVKATLHCN